MSSAKKINTELKLICNYLGLITAKYITVFLLAIAYYPMRPTPVYIIASAIALPPLFRYAFYANTKQDAVKNFILFPTAQHYGFTIQKYNSEKWSYIIIIAFIMAWQLSVNYYNAYNMPITIFPSIILIINIFSRLIGRIYFKIKLHMNFKNMDNLKL